MRQHACSLGFVLGLIALLLYTSFKSLRLAALIFVAVPVAPPERLDYIRKRCDTLVCLQAQLEFMAVGQFYERFDEVTDEQVCDLLRSSLVHHVIP